MATLTFAPNTPSSRFRLPRSDCSENSCCEVNVGCGSAPVPRLMYGLSRSSKRAMSRSVRPYRSKPTVTRGAAETLTPKV